MKTSNDQLHIDCSVIDIADLARVQGGALRGPGKDVVMPSTSTSTSTTTTTNTNKGADAAYYCKNGLDTQVELKDGSLDLKTPAGIKLTGHLAGTVTVCR